MFHFVKKITLEATLNAMPSRRKENEFVKVSRIEGAMGGGAAVGYLRVAYSGGPPSWSCARRSKSLRAGAELHLGLRPF